MLRLLVLALAGLTAAGLTSPGPTGSDPSERSGQTRPVATIQPADTVCPSGGRSLLPASSDLYCLELTATPRAPDSVAGVVELQIPPSPFVIAVDSAGHTRYRARLFLDNLPPPSSLGEEYTRWVAWVTTPVLRPEIRLGEVREGWTDLGEISLNKFLIMVSAEGPEVGDRRTGRLLLRGGSPSTRMYPPDMFEYLLGAGSAVSGNAMAGAGGHGHGGGDPDPDPAGWPRPPMPTDLTMLPALMELAPPDVTPYLPRVDDPESVPFARPRELVRLADGDTLAMDATYVRRRIRGSTHLMYGFNGQYPGPLVWVTETATITVRFTNRIDWPTTVHWHGIRIDNRSDGVPGVTQEPVPPGESFDYTIHFKDPGIYWYHPHHREDVLKDLGLYGNLMVRPERPDYYGPTHREEVVMLDDLLLDSEDQLFPFGRERSTHSLMGRFGNVFLVNGEPEYSISVDRGEVVRFFLTNVSNTRTFNLTFGGAPMKVVGSDIGLYERETWSPTVVIGPAERSIVHVRFDEAGSYALTNRVVGMDHLGGRFIDEVDTLGVVTVSPRAAEPGPTRAFDALREHTFIAEEIDPYRAHFDRDPDHSLVLTMEADGLPFVVDRLMVFDSAYFNPVEWSGTMPMMNWNSTSDEVRWILRDPETGRENMDIGWSFALGDVVKIRLHNERRAFHAMQHPIHLHGQRFLVVSVNGVPNPNLVWKDTFLLPVGATADILLELSNPGAWMMHCHISEHLEAGMRSVFTVR